MTTTTLHPFAHIMDGPYKILNYTDAVSIALQASLLKDSETLDLPKEGDCIGTCKHCNKAISYGVKIQGSKGSFVVGETCAEKIDGEIARVVKAHSNDRKKRQRNSKISNDFALNLEWMESPELKELPHPKGFYGLSLYDALTWYRDNAGKAKFNQFCKAQKG